MTKKPRLLTFHKPRDLWRWLTRKRKNEFQRAVITPAVEKLLLESKDLGDRNG